MSNSIIKSMADENQTPRIEDIVKYIRNDDPDSQEVLHAFQNRKDCHLLCLSYLNPSLFIGCSSYFADIVTKFVNNDWDQLDIQTQKYFITATAIIFKLTYQYMAFNDESAISIHQLFVSILIKCLPNKYPAGLNNLLYFDKNNQMCYHHSLHSLYYLFQQVFESQQTTDDQKDAVKSFITQNQDKIIQIFNFAYEDGLDWQAISYASASLLLMKDCIKSTVLKNLIILNQTMNRFLKVENDIENLGPILLYISAVLSNFPNIESLKNYFEQFLDVILHYSENENLYSTHSKEVTDFLICFLVNHFEIFNFKKMPDLVDKSIKILESLWDSDFISSMIDYCRFWKTVLEKNIQISENQELMEYYIDYLPKYLEKVLPAFLPSREFQAEFPEQIELDKYLNVSFKIIFIIKPECLINVINEKSNELKEEFDLSTLIALMSTVTSISEYINQNEAYSNVASDVNNLFNIIIEKVKDDEADYIDTILLFTDFLKSFPKLLSNNEADAQILIDSFEVHGDAVCKDIIDLLSMYATDDCLIPILRKINSIYSKIYSEITNNEQKSKLLSLLTNYYIKTDDKESLTNEILFNMSKVRESKVEEIEELLNNAICLESIMINAFNYCLENKLFDNLSTTELLSKISEVLSSINNNKGDKMSKKLHSTIISILLLFIKAGVKLDGTIIDHCKNKQIICSDKKLIQFICDLYQKSDDFGIEFVEEILELILHQDMPQDLNESFVNLMEIAIKDKKESKILSENAQNILIKLNSIRNSQSLDLYVSIINTINYNHMDFEVLIDDTLSNIYKYYKNDLIPKQCEIVRILLMKCPSEDKSEFFSSALQSLFQDDLRHKTEISNLVNCLQDSQEFYTKLSAFIKCIPIVVSN